MSRKLTRRQFIGASVGVAAAASLGGAGATLGVTGKGGRPTIPPGLLGVQQFSVRDATARLSIASSNRLGVAPTMGFLGGPDYPDDPTDLGPLVPLPGGYAEVFEYLASVDVRGFEFFQSTQNVNELGRQPTAAEIRQYLDAAGLKAVGTHQFGLGNLDPATGNLTAAGETLFEFLSTLGMETMGFSGNLSQIPNNSPDPANPSDEPPERLGLAGGLREPGDGRPHLRVQEPGGAREPHRRDPAVARGQVLLPPGAGQLPLLQRSGAPRARHGAPDPVGDGEHRPRPLRMADRHPAQLVGPRPLPERDHAPARHQRVGARAGAEPPGAGLAHQGRLPEHRADRDLGGRPAGERRRAVLPDVRAHGDVHRRDRVGRGRPGRGARPRRTRTPIRTAPASSTCSRTWAGTSAST